jgi:hypothetical protein
MAASSGPSLERMETIRLLQAHGKRHRRPVQHPRRYRPPLQFHGFFAELNGNTAAGQGVEAQHLHQRFPG